MDLTAIPSPAPCLSVVKTCDDHKLMHDLGKYFSCKLICQAWYTRTA